MTVSARLRYEILRRDGHACRYCGARAPDAVLTVDHVVPVSLGGTDEPSNLVAACDDCNVGKASSNPDAPLVAAVADDALRWAAARSEAAAIQAADRVRRSLFIDAVGDAWNAWHFADDGSTLPRDYDWRQSVGTFYDLGLDAQTVVDHIEQTMAAHTRDPWRYLCGCCWRTIRERDRIATGLIAQEEGDRS